MQNYCTPVFSIPELIVPPLFLLFLFFCEQSVLVNSSARVVHTAWHPDPNARALLSLSAGTGQTGKHFSLHLHGGLRA